ncbi:MAG TPA: sterol desaturase family protein [Alphaproteobacteria bacterium]|nr:sterol desaturase family protein [Alphaproteobacteria bacterium]
MDDFGETLLAFKGVAVGAWLALLFFAERLHPAVAFPDGRAWALLRPARNLAFLALSAVVSLAVVVPVSRWAAGLELGLRPASARGGAGLLLDLLLLDFLIYWWHRANHRIGFLWRFHEVHHLDRFLDVTSAVRFHFGEVILSALARAGVIVLFAMPLSSVLTFEALVLAGAAFHHSNLKLPHRLEKALSWLIVTPSIHWVHHHRIRNDTDSNYATVLSLWDRLFASRSMTPRTPKMEIGVEGREEQDLPLLLARPFRLREAGGR